MHLEHRETDDTRIHRHISTILESVTKERNLYDKSVKFWQQHSDSNMTTDKLNTAWFLCEW